MSDDSLRGRLASFLAPSQDDNVSPQARDEDPTVVGREEFRQEADAQEIAEYTSEYYRNPLVRVPIQNFAADVTEPGVSVTVETPEDTDVPMVPESARQYAGRPLDAALEDWVTSSYIDGFSFDANASDLLEEVVKDRRGRRGTAIVEHAYDDPRERERLMGLRPLKVETTTAYTREGKRIALRPDDDPGSFDSVAIDDLGDYNRDKAPETPAGQTAAIAQFDEVFGSEDREEIPFALDDLTISAHDADTGALFGEPDSATVINRAKSLRRKLRHVDQSVVNTAFGNIVAQVDSESEDVVKAVRDNLDVNVKDRGEDADPESVSVTNAPVDISEIDASVPQITEHIKQEVEFVLAAMPTPLYRVGFAGDINRDVTAEQGEDYRDAVKRERRRLESDFQGVLAMKTRELLYGDAHADESVAVTPRLRIRPSDSESPLRDEEFDAGEFGELMSALSTAAGPKGGATALMPEEVIVDTLLDMDPDVVLGGDGPAPDAAPAGEASAAVREAFDEFHDAELASDPFADIPVIPEGTTQVLPRQLQDWAAWVSAGRPDFAALRQWNPALHPRDPETGQFVERSFEVADSDLEAIQSGDPARLLRFISDLGGRSQVEEVLQADGVSIDGVPDNLDTKSELVDYIDSTDAEERLPPSARVDSEGTAEMFDEEFTGTESVDLLDSDAPPGERRELVDKKQRGPRIPPELVKNKEVPIGEEILVNEGGSTVPRTVTGYERPTDAPYPVIKSGSTTVDPGEVREIYRSAPRADAELSFDDWPDRYSERKQTVEDAIQQTVAKPQNSPVGRTIRENGTRKTPRIDNDTFDNAAERIASVLADIDREMVESVLPRLSTVGDDLSRAHAGDRPGKANPRAYMDISEGERQSTIKHELGHVMASSQGFGDVDAGASSEMNFFPASGDDVDLSADGDPVSVSGFTTADDPVSQFTIGYSNDEIAESYGVNPDSDESRSVGRSDWEEQVREEIPESVPELGARNFRNTGNEYLLEAEEGDMIRADGPQSFGRHLSIQEVDDDPVGVADRDIVALGENGDEYEFRVRDSFGEVTVETKDITDDPSRETVLFRVAGKRQSTPDGFGDSEPDTPDADEVLGGDPADTPQERMREFVTAANRAWFRSNLAANRIDEQLGGRFTVKSGYSSTSAHEVIAQTVEMMHASRASERKVNSAAARLVRNNPELIEKYRHIADIPDPMRSAINEELEINGHDFRLGGTE